MDTLRLLKIAGYVLVAIVALTVISALASLLLSLLGIVVGVAIVVGIAYLAYKLYAMTGGADDDFGVESAVEDLEHEFER